MVIPTTLEINSTSTQHVFKRLSSPLCLSIDLWMKSCAKICLRSQTLLKRLPKIELNIDLYCPICKCPNEESIKHIFLECKAVKKFWACLRWQNHNSLNGNHWLIQRDIEFKLLTEKLSINPPKLLIKINWHKPQKGWFKLNVDANFNNYNQSCGLGGIFRNANGNWVVAFTKSAHVNGSLAAELKSLREGLRTAMDWNLFPLEIKTGCTEVVNAPTEGYPPAHLQAGE
ncbi:uncharacterized protein [Nicotiana sylvestris]|uniref:uncharacterized protein n=1 Tax=Nicotiana sylvestris TaxID=4096 RepID=UPI00388C9DC7